MNDTYVKRSFPFSRYFIKVIIVMLIIFLMVWFTHKENCNQEQTNNRYIIQEIKKGALKYYNQQRLNSLEIQEDKVSIKELNLKNEKEFRLCDQNKSYIKLKKEKKIYSMKIYALCNNKKKEETIYLKHTNDCKTYLCEIKRTIENKGENHNIEEGDDLDTKSDDNFAIKEKRAIDTGSITVIDTTNHNYMYQYIKINNIKYSQWSNWYNIGEVPCNESNIFCTETSICLKEEKIEKYSRDHSLKKYSKNKVSIQEVGSRIIMGCDDYYYISFNNTLYQTHLDYSNIQNWKYEGRYLYQIPPKDTLYTKYLYVNMGDLDYNSNFYGAKKYYFDKYTFSGLSLANLNCPYKSYKNVKNYSYYFSPVINDKEDKVDGKCYKMTRIRTIQSDNDFIWSSYNNQMLLNQGYQYTGKRKIAS